MGRDGPGLAYTVVGEGPGGGAVEDERGAQVREGYYIHLALAIRTVKLLGLHGGGRWEVVGTGKGFRRRGRMYET